MYIIILALSLDSSLEASSPTNKTITHAINNNIYKIITHTINNSIYKHNNTFTIIYNACFLNNI